MLFKNLPIMPIMPVFGAGCILLSSCAGIHPNPVQLPKGAAVDKSIASKSLKKIETPEQLVENLEIYSNFFQYTANKYYRNETIVDEVGMLGALGGLGGGIGKAPDVALAGLITTGVASGIKSRYSLRQQASNYQTASDVFSSMYSIAAQYTSDYEEMTLSPEERVKIDNLIHQCLKHLRSKQLAIDLQTVDFEALVNKSTEAETAKSAFTTDPDSDTAKTAMIAEMEKFVAAYKAT